MIQDMSGLEFKTSGIEAASWSVVTHNGVVMEPTVQKGALRLDISNTSGANWHGELQHAPFRVKAGDTITVSFYAKAESPFTFSVWLGQDHAPHQSLVAKEKHFGESLMTSEWQKFEHTWKAVTDEQSARVNWVLGQIDNVVEIKNISLSRHRD